MAVREADKAIDEWLTAEIVRIKGFINNSIDEVKECASRGKPLNMTSFYLHIGRLESLIEAQRQLHEFWGAALIDDGGVDEQSKTGGSTDTPTGY